MLLKLLGESTDAEVRLLETECRAYIGKRRKRDVEPQKADRASISVKVSKRSTVELNPWTQHTLKLVYSLTVTRVTFVLINVV